MMRQQIRQAIELAVKIYGGAEAPEFSVAPPENPEHGDYATNAAMVLARALKKNPMDAAAAIAERLDTEAWSVETALPGFINFHLKPQAVRGGLERMLSQGEKFGAHEFGAGKKARIEYVSANPTGPIHIGNARGGPIGEAIARVLARCGYEVLREYLDNNVGTQVEKMGATLLFWYRKALGDEGEFPEDGYPGEYLHEVADEALRIEGRSLAPDALTRFGLDYIFKENMETSRRLGIRFDKIVKEAELISSGRTAEAVEAVRAAGAAVEKDGALWFAPGDEFLKDRESVVIRSTGQPTYFASDIAYHREKFQSGYDLVIDVMGSNHHGHVPKLRALTKIFGFDPARFIVILYQYVRVKRGAQILKMAKRAGTYITAREVLDEVGADSTIFFLLMSGSSTHMDFDLALAKEQSRENPVYYAQYAHARAASILKTAAADGRTGEGADTALLGEKEELDLIKKMLQLPDVVEDTARDFQVHRIPRFALDLARAFHHFYERHRVIAPDAALTASRLALVRAAKTVLASALSLIGVSAPEKM